MNGAGHGTTRADLIDLKQERQVVQEGYQFLDEKRLLLASQILTVMEDYEKAWASFMEIQRDCRLKYSNSLGRFGMQWHRSFGAYEAGFQLRIRRQNFLGVNLMETSLRETDERNKRVDGDDDRADMPVLMQQTAAAMKKLLVQACAVSNIRNNLYRLLHEYRLTQRRAFALENVLLPEIETAIKHVSDRIEEIDMEEAVRVRLFKT